MKIQRNHTGTITATKPRKIPTSHTKGNPSLLKELGWGLDKNNDWIYPDGRGTATWIANGNETNFTLKQIVLFMIREERSRLKSDIINSIVDVPSYIERK